ncbi:small integral membrane protein 12-B-like [Glandiceps talaboti]
MWQIILAGARTYAPYITFPVALVVGVIGYNIESFIRGDKNKGPQTNQIVEKREERQLEELSKDDLTQVSSLKEYKGNPKFLYEKTLRAERKD